jgi:hypothetical protein
MKLATKRCIANHNASMLHAAPIQRGLHSPQNAQTLSREMRPA